MFIWEYDATTEELTVMRVDQGVTHKTYVRNVVTAKQLAYWLKFYETLDLDTFKLSSRLDSETDLS